MLHHLIERPEPIHWTERTEGNEGLNRKWTTGAFVTFVFFCSGLPVRGYSIFAASASICETSSFI